MRKCFLKPGRGAEGQPLMVWNPSRGRYVPETGEMIMIDAYMERRIADGELVEVKDSVADDKKNNKKEVG